MRILLQATLPERPIPYSYQYLLYQTIHSWLGPENEWHGKHAGYTFGNLRGARGLKSGLVFEESFKFEISSPQKSLLTTLIKGLEANNTLPFGNEIKSVQLLEKPVFLPQTAFYINTPIVLKKPRENGGYQYLQWDDREANQFLFNSCKRKLTEAGLGAHVDTISVRFDPTIAQPKSKLIQIKGVDVKGSICPVRIEGNPEAIAHLYYTGLGSSTGMGFGFVQ